MRVCVANHGKRAASLDAGFLSPSGAEHDVLFELASIDISKSWQFNDIELRLLENLFTHCRRKIQLASGMPEGMRKDSHAAELVNLVENPIGGGHG